MTTTSFFKKIFNYLRSCILRKKIEEGLIFKGNIINVEPGPPPQKIIWTNIEFYDKSSLLKLKTKTFFLTIILFLVCFSLILLVAYLKVANKLF